ncbi:MAG: 30S ribosomal protein S3, partial [Kiritimatiellae bacterium]|nr:30S ribosomal protein S3 [Kiritimatiellia bacterium]
MGQKVNPIGLRVTVNKNWGSRWFANKKDFGNLLHEDLLIRKVVLNRLKDAAVPEVLIERYANRARITIFTARPGIVIGRKGTDIERIREELTKMTGKEIYVDIKEVRSPDLDAQLVSEGIALQLERRVSFRRAMKRAIQMAMELGALGVRVEACGRLGGAELARRESYKEGKVPLHTLRANIDYGF